MEHTEQITPIPLTEEKMTKQELSETLRATRQSHDAMLLKLQNSEEEFKRLVDHINKQQEEFNRVTETAEGIITGLNAFHKRRTEAVFTVMKSMEVLFEEPNFNKGEK